MSRYKRIPITELIVDERYQRPLDAARVKKIVDNYDEARFGVLEASDRGGHYAIFDGQHRLVAARKLGIEKVPCLVHTGLTARQEADLFVSLQRDRKGINSVERFRARVFAGDPVAVEIQNIVDGSPFHIDDRGSDRGTARAIKSVTTLERIHRRGVLAYTLDTLDGLWGGDNRSTDSGLIEGLSLLIEGYENRLDDEARERLRAVPPIDIVRRSMGHMTYASSKSSDRRLAVLHELRKIAGVRGRPLSRKDKQAS